MKSLKDLLSNTFQATWKTKLLTEWPTIMGNLKDQVTLEKIYDDNLVLGVRDTSWLHELYMLSPVLIKSINAHLEKPYIKTIRLKQSTATKKKELIPEPAPVSHASKPLLLHTKDHKALASIKDDSLKNVIKTFLHRCQQEKV